MRWLQPVRAGSPVGSDSGALVPESLHAVSPSRAEAVQLDEAKAPGPLVNLDEAKEPEPPKVSPYLARKGARSEVWEHFRYYDPDV